MFDGKSEACSFCSYFFARRGLQQQQQQLCNGLDLDGKVASCCCRFFLFCSFLFVFLHNVACSSSYVFSVGLDLDGEESCCCCCCWTKERARLPLLHRDQCAVKPCMDPSLPSYHPSTVYVVSPLQCRLHGPLYSIDVVQPLHRDQCVVKPCMDPYHPSTVDVVHTISYIAANV